MGIHYDRNIFWGRFPRGLVFLAKNPFEKTFNKDKGETRPRFTIVRHDFETMEVELNYNSGFKVEVDHSIGIPNTTIDELMAGEHVKIEIYDEDFVSKITFYDQDGRFYSQTVLYHYGFCEVSSPREISKLFVRLYKLVSKLKLSKSKLLF